MSANPYVNDQSSYAHDRVIAFFSRRQDAYRAMEALRDAGFNANEIGLIARDASETGTAVPAAQDDRSFWEKVKDFFHGEEHGDSRSDYADATSDLSWTGDRAEYYRQGVRSGGALVIVTSSRGAEARRILEASGGDLRESGFDMSAYSSSADVAEGADQHIQLRGERLRTYKERVQRGEVRLRKEVVTENQRVDVPVTREEIVIERTPGSGKASGDIGTDQEIRVPLSEERVRVEKEPVVHEEVRVGKRQVESARPVDAELRHEELRVEKEGDVDLGRSTGRRRKDPAA